MYRLVMGYELTNIECVSILHFDANFSVIREVKYR